MARRARQRTANPYSERILLVQVQLAGPFYSIIFNMINARYIEFKLDDASKAYLKALTKKLFGNSYPNVFCDHVTLAYGQEQVAAFDEGLMGVFGKFEAWNVISDEKGAALELDREKLKCLGVNNEHPHVTLACAAGIKPVYSNTLIAEYYSGSFSAKATQLEEPCVISGTVRAVN